MNEPELHLTPYTIGLAITVLTSILASPAAASLLSAQLQSWMNLLSIVVPAIMAVIFISPALRTRLPSSLQLWRAKDQKVSK